MNKITIGIIFLLLFIISCADQIVSTCSDDLPGPGFNASFSSIQENVLTPNCARSGCHTGSNPPEGLDLASGKSYTSLVNTPSQQSNLLRVKPGSSSESWMIKKLKAEGTSVMPVGLPLTQAVIDTIMKWIDQGAQND